MRTLFAALALVLHAAAWAQAPDPVAEDLREAVRGVLKADDAYGRNELDGISLDREIRILDRLLASGKLNPTGTALAYFWRARAHSSLNLVRMRKGQGADPALARKALADFDASIAVGAIDARLSAANTQYMAGTVALNHLGDLKRALAYWEKCADSDHAGCMNIIAGARLTGLGGTPVDFETAVELNRRVYDTGTDFQCAGAYSALTIALIVHGGRLAGATVDEFEWLRRARQLLDELAARDQDDNPCDRAKFEIYEYLMRLKGGEDRRDLLASAAARKRVNSYAPLAEYLAGTRSAEAFERSIADARPRHIACSLHFGAAWHAGLRRNAAAQGRHLAAMRAIGAACETELALMPTP